MAGPPDKMDAENLYVKSLSQTTTYQIAQDVLTFFDAATKTKVVFKAAKSSEKWESWAACDAEEPLRMEMPYTVGKLPIFVGSEYGSITVKGFVLKAVNLTHFKD